MGKAGRKRKRKEKERKKKRAPHTLSLSLSSFCTCAPHWRIVEPMQGGLTDTLWVKTTDTENKASYLVMAYQNFPMGRSSLVQVSNFPCYKKTTA